MVGTIYKISFMNQNIPLVYYGETHQKFNRRKAEHKSRCYNSGCDAYYKPLYQFIRENVSWEDVKFDVLAEYENIDKSDLRRLEQAFILADTNVLNARK